jgi:hypothetical protein
VFSVTRVDTPFRLEKGKFRPFPSPHRCGNLLPRDAAALYIHNRSGTVNDCEEKNRLAMEYDATTAKFSEAVNELRRKLGTSAKEDYERLDRAANEARVKSEQARLALEQHIAAHRC